MEATNHSTARVPDRKSPAARFITCCCSSIIANHHGRRASMSRSISPSTVIAQHQHGGSGWNHDVSPIENLDIFWKLCKGCSSATSSATARQQRLVSNGSSASARQPDRGARSPTTGKLTTNVTPTAVLQLHAQNRPSCRHPTQREIPNSYQNQYMVTILRNPK